MTDRTNRERRLEAAALCRRLAELETDPGSRGYSQGMAERLERNHWERVGEDYVARVRQAVEDLEEEREERAWGSLEP